MHEAYSIRTESREGSHPKKVKCRQPTLTQASVVDSTAQTRGPIDKEKISHSKVKRSRSEFNFLIQQTMQA